MPFISAYNHVFPLMFIFTVKILSMEMMDYCCNKVITITFSPRVFMNENLLLLYIDHFNDSRPSTTKKPFMLIKRWYYKKMYWNEDRCSTIFRKCYSSCPALGDESGYDLQGNTKEINRQARHPPLKYKIFLIAPIQENLSPFAYNTYYNIWAFHQYRRLQSSDWMAH